MLLGDFNGDGIADAAVLVVRRATGQLGVAFLHAGASRPVVVGAGRSLGNGGANFDWLDAWRVQPRATVGQIARRPRWPVLRGDALHVEKQEAASALIYWDGSRYRWHALGD